MRVRSCWVRFKATLDLPPPEEGGLFKTHFFPKMYFSFRFIFGEHDFGGAVVPNDGRPFRGGDMGRSIQLHLWNPEALAVVEPGSRFVLGPFDRGYGIVTEFVGVDREFRPGSVSPSSASQNEVIRTPDTIIDHERLYVVVRVDESIVRDPPFAVVSIWPSQREAIREVGRRMEMDSQAHYLVDDGRWMFSKPA